MAIELVLCYSGKLWDCRRSAEFDARCYQQIFALKYPDTTFMPADAIIVSASVTAGWRGGPLDRSALPLSDAVRVSNRNDLHAEEIQRRERFGFRILSRRNLTAYMFDEEVLEALCAAQGLPTKIGRASQICSDAMEISVMLGHEPDNWELTAPTVCPQLGYELDLKLPRLDWREFVATVLAPMLAPGTAIYDTLDRELFGPDTITGLAVCSPSVALR